MLNIRTKTISLVNKEDYLVLAATSGSDIALNKKVLAANEILKFIRRGELLSVAHLHGFDAEVVDLKRLSFGGIELNNLPTGKTRYLERSEYVHLREFLDAAEKEQKGKAPAKKRDAVESSTERAEKTRTAAKKSTHAKSRTHKK